MTSALALPSSRATPVSTPAGDAELLEATREGCWIAIPATRNLSSLGVGPRGPGHPGLLPRACRRSRRRGVGEKPVHKADTPVGTPMGANGGGRRARDAAEEPLKADLEIAGFKAQMLEHIEVLEEREREELLAEVTTMAKEHGLDAGALKAVAGG